MSTKKLILLSMVILGCVVYLTATLVAKIGVSRQPVVMTGSHSKSSSHAGASNGSKSMNSPTGSANAADISSIEFSISNGTVTCVADEAEPGSLTAEWEITDKSGKADLSKMDIAVRENGGRWEIEDKWGGMQWSHHPEVNLTIHHHPEITVSGGLGNGTLDLSSPRLEDVSLGNGEIKLDGELLADGDISLGNGEISGSLLIADGSHDISLGNGSVNLTVREGSSFSLDSSVGIGDISVRGAESKRDWGFLGGSVSANIGDSKGSIDLSIGNGSAQLTVQQTAAAN